MDAAEFFDLAHRGLRQLLAESPHGAQLPVALWEDGEGVTVTLIEPWENIGAGIMGGLSLIGQRQPARALFGFSVEASGLPGAAGPSFDFVICGTYFERGAPVPIRPFILEWESPVQRLGWFEWPPVEEAAVGDMNSGAERLFRAMHMVAEMAGAGVLGVRVAGADDAEQADFTICTRKADDAGHFSDNLEGACSRCGETVIFRPHAPKRPPKLCAECACAVLAEPSGETPQ